MTDKPTKPQTPSKSSKAKRGAGSLRRLELELNSIAKACVYGRGDQERLLRRILCQ